MFKVGDSVTPITAFHGLTVGKSYTIVHWNTSLPSQQWLKLKTRNKLLKYKWFNTESYLNNQTIKHFILTSEYLTNKNFNNTLNKVLE